MQVTLVDRTHELPPDIRDYATRRLASLEGHFDLIQAAEMEFDRDSKRSREPIHVVEVTLRPLAHNQPTLRAREGSRDLRQAVDLALEAIDREVVELKESVRGHPSTGS